MKVAAKSQIVLLTPYTGHNLGDAAIQDSMIANLKALLPGAEFSGITLNNENFVRHHGAKAFPLCAIARPFYGMTAEDPAAASQENSSSQTGGRWKQSSILRTTLRPAYRAVRALFSELRHWTRGYSFLRGKDLLIVSGGGQLDDEWGGPWGHPYGLFKWAMLAKMAGVPYVMASVGACKASSSVSRFFLSSCLRRAAYRSYREQNTKNFSTALYPAAEIDPVVPDLAFALPAVDLPPAVELRSSAKGRKIVAFSPIVFGKKGRWPSRKQETYDRYLGESAKILSELLRRGYFLMILWSSLGDDASVVPELLAKLDSETKARFAEQLYIPSISSWRDVIANLRTADVLIASRLHSLILGMVCCAPAIAISFDPKVDWLMQDLKLTEYRLDITDFLVAQVLEALDSIQAEKPAVLAKLATFRQQAAPHFKQQFQHLAKIALSTKNAAA